LKSLLFLVHRLPYPPNKGDKIRSYHLLKYLSQRYRVFLGTFIDDPQDWTNVKDVQVLSEDICVRPLKPRQAMLKSLKGFATGEALTLPYYRDAVLQQWVDRSLEQASIGLVLVFSSSMAQYVRGATYSHLRRVIDLVDVDSDKWHQYSRKKRWPLSWVYAREGELLERFEREVAIDFDASLLVSRHEAALFRRLVPAATDRIDFYDNGVDMDYFNPELVFERPYAMDERVLVFTGAMNYWANVDAVTWFASEVFPQVRRTVPEARFYIVGIHPTDEVRNLGNLPGITVADKVPDIRPFLKYAYAAVAPMLIARGVQNKVLEAMAMARPVVATSAAMEGIETCAILESLVVDDVRRYADICVRLLRDGDKDGFGMIGRRCMKKFYDWDANLSRVDVYLH
jgi:sugar transferase (PEP-CTERM/EpsH1 system associated)